MSERSNRSRWRRRPGKGLLTVALGLLVAGLVPPAEVAAVPARPAGAAGGSTAGAPVVADLANGDTTLFARGLGDILYRRVHRQADDSWDGWKTTGGSAASDPVTARELNKRLSVFARRSDGHLWWQRQKADSSWSAWIDLETPTGTTAVGAPVVVTDDNTFSDPTPNGSDIVPGNSDGRLELFVRGADGQLWHRMQKSPNGSEWSKWEALPGRLWAGFTAVTGPDGRITVVGRKDDGRLRVTTQQRPSKSDKPLPEDNWPEWKEIGTGYGGGLAVATNIRKDGTALLQVFGNKSDGTLWTTTQTSPGTSQNRSGNWDPGSKLGPALAGRTAVATHSDGRLAVFGIDGQEHVAYRTQTAAATSKNPNGVWEGNWRTLGNRTARTLALRPAPGTDNSGFAVFVLDKSSGTLYQRSRLVLGAADGSRPDVWLDWTDLAAAGDGPCDGPGSADCFNIVSDLGLTLGLTDPNNADSEVNRGPSKAIDWQQWSVRQTGDWNGAVQIVNRSWNRCLQRGVENGWDPIHFTIAPCDSGAPQGWLLEPVSASGTDPAHRGLAGYRIKDSASPGKCLTALAENRWRYDAQLATLIPCDSADDNDHNIWKLGHGNTASPGILNVALDQATRKCANDSTHTVDVCKFVPTKEPSAYRSASGCVAGKVVFNQGSTTSSYTVSWTRTKGTEFTFGYTFGVNIEVLSEEYSASFSWLQQNSVTDQMILNVPPGEFGWVEVAPVQRETIGYWEITVDHQTWTIPGHNLSYAQDGTNGARILNIFHTSPTPPTSRSCAE